MGGRESQEILVGWVESLIVHDGHAVTGRLSHGGPGKQNRKPQDSDVQSSTEGRKQEILEVESPK